MTCIWILIAILEVGKVRYLESKPIVILRIVFVNYIRLYSFNLIDILYMYHLLA